ncbi:MAG: TIGR03618 family F420-dependent PPOX class oxidoreductase [Chloroflexi bacterium]|nr:TIGR03618 family F420-dependent PPOX class oxidoreductase [Chloroflexota bacterium]
MIGTPQFDDFITEHRWCVITTLRKDGSPTSSVNAYAREGDELVISTQGHRLKVRTLDRDPRITVLVLNDASPFNFVSVEGTAAIQRGDVLEPTRTVFRSLAKINYPEPADLPKWIKEQGRVIIRVTPTRVSGVIR